ncbi:NADH dehydrogenase [ubiquinone] 1 beta subcomplex subunit 2, mitochondrial-like [Malaya genurostris]|uniref:NADH dehydrogenase [ubiquinone] 1 beta subcomplex subunit 2, mitochondrial-like n=1 Tax=Malaya genurostris TaxID=325434 RepID=UPI0026F3BC02|nr:NADH dehydrogenase [ubiquinone] 1 beta subcomplex subunit 2, mitochondrial-like [Malaya genurostris]
MLPSRALLLGRMLQRTVANRGIKAAPLNPIVRQSHTVSYRVNGPKPSRVVRGLTQFCGGLMWWWVLWHLFHEYEHITGEFAYPDPKAWTNAELGIPPDNE